MKGRLKESECIHYKDLIKSNNHKRKLLREGFKFINRINPYKKILAYALISVGVVTLPLPTGSIFLIGLGLGMLGIKKDYLKKRYKKFIYYQKAKLKNKRI